jgi:hypothetical protein
MELNAYVHLLTHWAVPPPPSHTSSLCVAQEEFYIFYLLSKVKVVFEWWLWFRLRENFKHRMLISNVSVLCHLFCIQLRILEVFGDDQMFVLLACRPRCYIRALYDSYFIIMTKLNFNLAERYPAFNFYDNFFIWPNHSSFRFQYAISVTSYYALFMKTYEDMQTYIFNHVYSKFC